MTVRHEPWPEGAPAWVDLTVPDHRVGRAFYGSLFGWEFDGTGPESGYYANCLKDGEPVAGIGEPVPGEQAAPPAWVTYLAADDADAVVGRVTAAGGQVVVDPTSIGVGRFAFLVDPTGAMFAVWESGQHTGMNRANEPGSVTWNEALSPDYDAAQAFYRSVFGYSFGDLPGDGARYATLMLGDQPVGGIGEIDASMAGTPPHWETYFSVADTDDTLARATAFGGTVRTQPFDSQFGRIAVLTGPFGETFSVLGPVPGGQQG